MKETDNNQYYYVPDSFHVSIKNIKTISDPPLFTDQDIEKAKSVFSKVIPKYESFVFELKGILELPTSLSIRAYSESILKDLVLDLNSEMKKVSLLDNKKYISDSIFFGNVTFCRYKGEPSEDFVNEIKKLKKIKIGDLKVKTISLITTNSICHPNKTKIIQNYNLKD